MSSGLLNIAASGARAARAALEVTSQNIANASTEGYVRRSVNLAEVAATGSYGRVGDISLSGVRVAGISRNADLFRQVEARRTGSDAARAGAELTGFENIESALDQSGVYDAMTGFESSLKGLAANPVDPSLRASALESARTLTRTFNIAAQSLDTVGEGLRFEANAGVTAINNAAGELARVNLQLSRVAAGSSDQSTLLDRRDALLQTLSDQTDITTSFAADNTVEVRIGGSSGPTLVQGGTASSFAMATATDGTVSFTLGSSPVTLSAGALAGKSLALNGVKDAKTKLDAIASSLITTANTAQTSGVALDGTAGQPLFSGTGAGDISLALTSGSQLATAPTGAAAGSRDGANLDALRNALSSANLSGKVDELQFGVSSAVAGRKTTKEALDTIASSSKIALEQQSGVNLDQEAVNLVRFQQAFQASGKAIQVASEIFDTLLAIR